MSEANARFNSRQPESDDPSAFTSNQFSSNREDEVTDSTKAAKARGEEPNPASSEQVIDLNQLMQQIFDASDLDGVQFEDSPEPSEIGAAESSLPNQPTSVLTNLSSIAAWSQDEIDLSAPSAEPTELQDELKAGLLNLPSASDLVTLIQELNQCNGVLMERVSQLEEALESSQNALQAEVARTQDVQPGYAVQDWAAVQEQITTLFNQLEFAHQTNQRQQILIETVTEQLENSQERIAQLEREAALLQQHYNEQTQLLAKSENTCRDLQSRLQRQQRYTLQFKAALEKSLEVPTPQYEAVIGSEPVTEAISEAPFLPKTRRIQPWSAQQHGDQSPWMKLHQLDLSSEAFQVELAEPAVSTPAPQNPTPAPAKTQTSHLNLPSFGLPLLQVTEDQSAEPTVDRDLAEQAQRLSHDSMLKQQLDEVVKPLADMLAEALLSEPTAQPPLPSPAQAAAINQPIHQPGEQIAGPEPNSADELLAATMADAEDALWQDLARLIDVSTEDVVKASLSGDLAAFESINFGALQPESPQVNQSSTPVQSPSAAQKPEAMTSRASAPALDEQQPPEIQAQPEADDQDLIPALANVSWPSPIVYPLRATKKRQSLAMVDLPTFPKA